MFSLQEKQHIAKKVEELLLSLNHPEMPKEKPKFHLRVDGAEEWSFAEIDPNWTFNKTNQRQVNPWNEVARNIMKP